MILVLQQILFIDLQPCTSTLNQMGLTLRGPQPGTATERTHQPVPGEHFPESKRNVRLGQAETLISIFTVDMRHLATRLRIN